MKDIKELGEQLGELQRVCREKKIPVMIAFEEIPITNDIKIIFTFVMIPAQASGMSPPYTDCAP